MKNETITHTITSIVGALLIGMAFVIADADNVVKGNQLDYFVLSIALFFFLCGMLMAIYGVVKGIESLDPLHTVRIMKWDDIAEFSYDVEWYDDPSTNCWGVVEDMTTHYVLLNDDTKLNEQQLEFFFEKFEKEIEADINRTIDAERESRYCDVD